jgi:FMN phosphatase YigB (HAD superfamily)
MKRYYFDVDGVLANFHKEKFEYKKAVNREWIANLEPFVENVELVRTLILRGEKVFIISKAASENARLGKLDWFKKYLPELVEENIFVIVGHGNKADYIQTEEAILFDDDMKNCRQWAKAGQTYYHLEIKGEKIIF